MLEKLAFQYRVITEERHIINKINLISKILQILNFDIKLIHVDSPLLSKLCLTISKIICGTITLTNQVISPMREIT